MKWEIYIIEEFKYEKDLFFDIIKNFNTLGCLIFKERNTLRKIHNDVLGTLAVKSFKKPILINQYIYSTFRKSKAYRSFYNAKFLLSKNINTPKPIAFFEQKKGKKLIHSFYFSEYYNYDFTFRELIEKKEMFADWNIILQKFTEFIYKMHNSQILFKDLSPGNILIKKINNLYEFSLIDLNRMAFKDLSWDERLQNFIRLSMTEDMINIIGKTYAKLTNRNEMETIKILIDKNQIYLTKKSQKQKFKKLIGKK